MVHKAWFGLTSFFVGLKGLLASALQTLSEYFSWMQARRSLRSLYALSFNSLYFMFFKVLFAASPLKTCWCAHCIALFHSTLCLLTNVFFWDHACGRASQ